MPGDDRVLAIMAKAPRLGHVKTRLSPAYAPDDVVRLYRALVEDTIDLVRAAGIRAVAACPAGDAQELAHWLPQGIEVLPQRGSGLAAGLVSTFEDLCTVAGRRVIAFNADSPHLPVDTLHAAFTLLATNDVVVGPCDDGGYYLVGAKQPYPALFDPGMMGKDTACETLLARAEQAGLRVALVAEHYDIDLPADVRRLATELAETPARAPRTARILSRLRER
jgi:uncharacterized protein